MPSKKTNPQNREHSRNLPKKKPKASYRVTFDPGGGLWDVLNGICFVKLEIRTAGSLFVDHKSTDQRSDERRSAGSGRYPHIPHRTRPVSEELGRQNHIDRRLFLVQGTTSLSLAAIASHSPVMKRSYFTCADK